MTFEVIDRLTGEEPDVEKIALTEDWANGLIYCDIDQFAIGEDGNLMLIDDCDNIAYCPVDRFEIRIHLEEDDILESEEQHVTNKIRGL